VIRYTQGNLLDAQVETLVNAVNTVGVMGKGIALMFREAFPENFVAYEAACKRGEVVVGRMFVTKNHAPTATGPRFIINFPTKKHWVDRSRLEWIEEGLQDLLRVVRAEGIRSVAMPALGCGLGGLSWSAVRAAIEHELGTLPGIDFVVYQPTANDQNQPMPRGVGEPTRRSG
jgi:O-acetyl-ADP-ribose deacetylase (regulator of RNase III)